MDGRLRAPSRLLQTAPQGATFSQLRLRKSVVPYERTRWAVPLEPIGFVKFAPAAREDPGGCESADHPKIARTAEGGACSKSLFGSGSASLGIEHLPWLHQMHRHENLSR